MYGVRVTDVVDFFRRRGELRGAVKAVRKRDPDRFRWRSGVGGVTASTAGLIGRERMRVEEPIREMVLDLPDAALQREVVLDARRYGVDLDRGEVMPRRSGWDLNRISYLTGTDLGAVRRYLALPADPSAPIDTSGVVLVGRALAGHHRKRAQRIWLELPDPDAPTVLGQAKLFHDRLAKAAARDARLGEQWAAFAKAVAVD